MEKLLSLFIGEILIERGDERGRINAMHKACFGDGFQRGMRAIQAVHAVRHEHRSDFGSMRITSAMDISGVIIGKSLFLSRI